ncbi:MAG: hypothetical protein AAFZ09_06340 [Pseudomonadota bacterium]
MRTETVSHERPVLVDRPWVTALAFTAGGFACRVPAILDSADAAWSRSAPFSGCRHEAVEGTLRDRPTTP